VESIRDIQAFCYKYGKKSLIIDTNILLLFFVGVFNKDYINKCSLTAGKYTPEDFDLLIKIISYFKPEIIITPQILAEISNHSKTSIKDPHFSNYFNIVVNRLKAYKEHHIALQKIIGLDIKILSNFGFTDMSIAETAKELESAILTDDYRLYAYCYKTSPSIKFSYIQNAGILPES
jgi:hypothetical protein